MDQLPSTLFTLASKFPSFATNLFNLSCRVYQSYQSQSPETRELIVKTGEKVREYVLVIVDYTVTVYPKVLEFGTIKVQEWRQPSDTILKPMANMVTSLFPIESNIDNGINFEALNTECIGLVGNEQVCIGSLSIISHFYLKTGKLPRIFIDQVNFKIIGWKHLVEYFGCLDKQKVDNLQDLKSVFVFYGDLESIKNDIALVPFTNEGANEMMTRLGDLPLAGGIPIMIPTAFHHQRLEFGIK